TACGLRGAVVGGRDLVPVGRGAVVGGRGVVTRERCAIGHELDEPVAHEALHRRVRLTDVERPRATRALLEALAQVVAVHRLLGEEGEHPLADGHGGSVSSYRVSLRT